LYINFPSTRSLRSVRSQQKTLIGRMPRHIVVTRGDCKIQHGCASELQEANVDVLNQKQRRYENLSSDLRPHTCADCNGDSMRPPALRGSRTSYYGRRQINRIDGAGKLYDVLNLEAICLINSSTSQCWDRDSSMLRNGKVDAGRAKGPPVAFQRIISNILYMLVCTSQLIYDMFTAWRSSQMYFATSRSAPNNPFLLVYPKKRGAIRDP